MASDIQIATESTFGPYAALAACLLPFLHDWKDGSHDLGHLLRVWSNIRLIQAEEGGDLEVLAAACLLHDCVAVEKNSARRNQASRLSAERAAQLLAELNWPTARINAVSHAIEAHSFSARIPPATLEARIIQDADRLDAIGALGVARCFYTAGRMRSALYDVADPHGLRRLHDDSRYAMDHFQTKLLRLASSFETETGQRLARARHERMERFLTEMANEIGAPRG